MNDTRLKIEHELRMGKKPKELSEKYNVPYATINSWKNKLRDEVVDEKVNEVVEVDEATLVAVADKIKAEAPADVAKKVDKLVDGVVGLKRLDEKFHTIVFELLEWAELKCKEELSVREWKDIASTIGNLYGAIFSKNVTNVMVNNQTNISSEKRQIFKSNLRS